LLHHDENNAAANTEGETNEEEEDTYSHPLARAHRAREHTVGVRDNALLLLGSALSSLHSFLDHAASTPTFSPSNPLLRRTFGDALARESPSCVLCEPIVQLIESEMRLVLDRDEIWSEARDIMDQLTDMHWEHLSEDTKLNWMAGARG